MKRLLAIAIALTFSPFASAPAATSATNTATATAQQQTNQNSPSKGFRARRIEGVWDEHVTITNCDTGATMAEFRSTDMFIAGGALTDTNSMPPSARGPGAGVWWHAYGRNFGAAMRFFRYAPDGSFAGVQEITRAISVDAGGDTLTGTINVNVLDPDDNLLQTACGTEEAMRVY